MKTIRMVLVALLGSLLLTGCISFNSLADARNSKGEGLIREFSKDKESVWQQTLAIVRHSDLKLVEDNPEKGLILAQQPVSPLGLTVGQNVAIYIYGVGSKTRVEVISKKAIGEIEFTSKNWESYIIEKLIENFG